MPQADVSRWPSKTSPFNGTRPITYSKSAVPSRLVFDEPERVADWARQRLPDFIGWNGFYRAIGRERDGELDAAVVYTGASPTNIVASIVLAAPLTRRYLYAIFHYPFVQLGLPRITALVDESNRRSLCFCDHLGFRVEGRLRQGAANGGDIIVLGMLKSECRYLTRPA